ncbi:hypothetical protein BJ912DRAFT_149017 [Pholiota molesta]|nr:hypothetical protein BJ912DRAFT_149017 [Pholiota molesta]
MATPIKDFTTTDPDLSRANYPPSHVVEPTRVDTAPQQGSTSPGDGHQVHTGNVVAPTQDANKEQGQNTGEVPFKERVIGVAQKTRGTVFGDQELKGHGEAILEGRTSHEQEVQERRRQD